jgi:hypothetical protein
MGVNLFVQMYSVQNTVHLDFEQDRLIILWTFQSRPS